MIQRYTITVAVAAAVMLSGQAAAGAATVYPEKGAVLVNSGHGFTRVSDVTTVAPGAQVMTRHGGVARIAYGGGCSEQVTPGEVKVVQSVGPCGAGAAADTGSPFLLAGTAALMGVGIGMWAEHDNDNGHDHRHDHPASP